MDRFSDGHPALVGRRGYRAAARRGGPVEMRFMDGPYRVELCANGPDNVRFRRQARSGPQTQHAGTADVLQIASALEKALAGVLGDAGSRGDGSAETADLVEAHARLVNAMEMARTRTMG
jgi:hypothetical protein